MATADDVKTAYQRIVQRDPSDAELASATTEINSGALTGSQFRAGLIATSEVQNNVLPVIRVYQAAFNRVPDQQGLDFYADFLAGRSTPKLTINDVSNAFANSPEFVSRYGSGPIDVNYINALFQNVLGRAPDTDGLNFYLNLANQPDQTRATLLTYFSQSPEFTTRASAGSATFLDAAGQGQSVYSGSLTLPAGGTSFTLTINQDTFTGSDNSDTFSAPAVAAAAGNLVDTLQNVDTINGGSGSDTLNVTLNSGATVTPSLNSVENVNLRATSPGSGLDIAASTGVTAIAASGSTQATFFNNIGAANTIGITNQNSNLTIGGAAGTATTLNLNLTAAGVVGGTQVKLDLGQTNASKATTAAVTTSGSNVSIDSTLADKFTTASVKTSGTNIITFADSAATLKTITVTGAGSLDLSGSGTFAALTSLDGSTSSAATKATVTGAATTVLTGSGADNITVTTALGAGANVNLGQGDDRLAVLATPGAGATLTGGDGVDTIAVTNAAYTAIAGFSAANLQKITAFEVLGITEAAATQTYDPTKFTTGNGITFEQGVGTLNTATVVGLTSGATITENGPLNTNNGTVVATVTGAAASTTDVLNLTAASSVEAATALNLNAAQVETVNVSTSGPTPATVSTFTLNLTDDQLTTLNLSGNDKVAFTAKGTQGALATVDAGANTGGAIVDVSAVPVGTSGGLTVTGTTANDVFTLKDFTNVAGNGGNDTFQFVTPTSGQTYSSVTDFNRGDMLQFLTTAATSFSTTKINLASTAVFQDYLDAATAGVGGGAVKFFQLGGDSFVVEDNSGAATFQNGTDAVVKLTGTVDLSTATFVGGIITG